MQADNLCSAQTAFPDNARTIPEQLPAPFSVNFGRAQRLARRLQCFKLAHRLRNGRLASESGGLWAVGLWDYKILFVTFCYVSRRRENLYRYIEVSLGYADNET